MRSLAESSTGYVHQFQVCITREGCQEKGLAHRVVINLTQHLIGSHTDIYFDNIYASINLMEELAVRGMNAYGTVRSNQKGLLKNELPSNIKLGNLSIILLSATI